MLRHVEVNDPAPIVGQDNQHEQHSQSRRGYSEEVNRHDVLDVPEAGKLTTLKLLKEAGDANPGPRPYAAAVPNF